MEPFAEIIAKYRPKGILIDSNLLLLLLVGTIDRDLVAGFKRTSQFVPEDYDLLSAIVSGFRRVVTTPHILAEVSNLAGAFDVRRKALFYACLSRYIEVVEERYTPASELRADLIFPHVGITDTAIALLTAGSLLLFTVDAKLAHWVASRNADVINFNHLRVLNW